LIRGTFEDQPQAKDPREVFRLAGREIDVILAKHRKIWPDICRIAQAVVARADSSETSYSNIGAFSLDIARRLTHPGLDCLGAVDKLIPPGTYRTTARHYAHLYCVADRSRLCVRLKD
jgi:hypothetical protein